MCNYIEEEITLSERAWTILEHMAEQQGMTLNEVVNKILREQLDKLDAIEAANSSQTVERDDGTEEDKQENP